MDKVNEQKRSEGKSQADFFVLMLVLSLQVNNFEKVFCVKHFIKKSESLFICPVKFLYKFFDEMVNNRRSEN